MSQERISFLVFMKYLAIYNLVIKNFQRCNLVWKKLYLKINILLNNRVGSKLPTNSLHLNRNKTLESFMTELLKND